MMSICKNNKHEWHYEDGCYTRSYRACKKCGHTETFADHADTGKAIWCGTNAEHYLHCVSFSRELLAKNIKLFEERQRASEPGRKSILSFLKGGSVMQHEECEQTQEPVRKTLYEYLRDKYF